MSMDHGLIMLNWCSRTILFTWQTSWKQSNMIMTFVRRLILMQHTVWNIQTTRIGASSYKQLTSAVSCTELIQNMIRKSWNFLVLLVLVEFGQKFLKFSRVQDWMTLVLGSLMPNSRTLEAAKNGKIWQNDWLHLNKYLVLPCNIFCW